MKIGCHLVPEEGLSAAAFQAKVIGANTFQYFTRNIFGRLWHKIDTGDVDRYLRSCKENDFSEIVAHAPFTINLCSRTERIRNYGKVLMKEDLEFLDMIGGGYYNFHPGSHTKQGNKIGIEQISGALNEILTPTLKTKVLLETMAGKGTEIGSTFEEIREIINTVNLDGKLGVCLDTCHVFDAGYDIVNDLDGVLYKFDKTIGMDRLCVIHLNDSKNALGSHKDRHEKIGKGKIGKEAIKRIVNHPLLKDKVFILETPAKILEDYEKEISLVKSLRD